MELIVSKLIVTLILTLCAGYNLAAPRDASSPGCGIEDEKCAKIAEEGATGSTSDIHLPSRRVSRAARRSCKAPPQPENGQWKLHSSSCEGDEDSSVPENSSLDPGSQLIYSCASGFKMEGTTNVYCNTGGKLSAIPVCKEVTCPPLNTPTTAATCSRLDQYASCETRVLPKTRAKVFCRVGYRKNSGSSSITRRDQVTCNANGQWEPEPIECIPVCGVPITQQTPFVFNGTVAKVTDFPWHATLYANRNEDGVSKKEFVCGATVISVKVVLTAAHCIYDEVTRTTTNPSLLYVATGNIFRDFDSPFHDPNTVRTARVKNIHRHCQYYGLEGNYATDIALLELREAFKFSNILLPACLDLSGYSEQILEPGTYGKVAGFGKTEAGTTSSVLQTITVPYVSYSQCKMSEKGAQNQVFIGNDKFCAGYTNGTAVCEGDSGGGLVFKKNDLWYVMGVVSVGLGVSTRNGERSCDNFSYTLYTKVDAYIEWIQDVLSQLERFKYYPLCGSTDANCIPLNTVSTRTSCLLGDEWQECDDPVPPSTMAKVTCREGYANNATAEEVVECQSSGTWSPLPNKCVPIPETSPATTDKPTGDSGPETTAATVPSKSKPKCKCVPYYTCQARYDSGNDTKSSATRCNSVLEVCCRTDDVLVYRKLPSRLSLTQVAVGELLNATQIVSQKVPTSVPQAVNKITGFLGLG